MLVRSAVLALLLFGETAGAAGMRFPQPVRVGDLPGRAVLEPVESQTELGTVRSVVRDGGGSVLIVIELRGWFGWTSRVVAVPVEAVALVGDAVDMIADTPEQLWKLPVFDPAGTTALGADATIKVGLAKPSH